MSLFQPVAHLTASQTAEQIFAGTYQGSNNFGSLFFIVAIAVVFLGFALASVAFNEEKRSKSRSKISHENLHQDNEDLPALVPVEASVPPVAEPVVVLEPAPVPVADPALGWSKPVYDEAVLAIPAFMRKVGLTSFEVYKFVLEPDWLKFYKLREQEKAAGLGHVTSAVDFFTRRESEPDPVFDPGERLPVGFDGVPVH